MVRAEEGSFVYESSNLHLPSLPPFHFQTMMRTMMRNRWASWTLEHQSRIRRCCHVFAALQRTCSECIRAAWRSTSAVGSASEHQERMHFRRMVRCRPSRSFSIVVDYSVRLAGQFVSRLMIGVNIELFVEILVWFHRMMLNGPAWVLRDYFVSSSMHQFEMSFVWCASRCSLRLEGEFVSAAGLWPRYTIRFFFWLSIVTWIK